jgi:endonuclease YncB( thermonuclease family)
MTQYKVIAGTFHVKGYQPDSDSIRFVANNPSNWDFFAWETEYDKTSKKNQLRLEAIDAPEIHYEGYQQPHLFAFAAFESMLGMLGIKSVVYSHTRTNVVDASDGKPGFIASARIDRFGRPESYIFQKSAKLTDGAVMDSATLPIENSLNFQLVSEGLVYPTFYATTDRTIAEQIRTVVARARTTKRGIWSLDRSSDFTIWDMRTLQEDILILPRMFRRIVGFLENYADFEKFSEYLAKQRDTLVLWDGTKKKSLADLMKINGRHVQMSTPIEDILFLPK